MAMKHDASSFFFFALSIPDTDFRFLFHVVADVVFFPFLVEHLRDNGLLKKMICSFVYLWVSIAV